MAIKNDFRHWPVTCCAGMFRPSSRRITWKPKPFVARRARSRSLSVTALDPVNAGFAQSLARPGGNISGVIYSDPALSAKSMQLNQEMLPGMKRIGLLYSPVPGIDSFVGAVEEAARKLDIHLYLLPVSRAEDIAAALNAAKQKRIDVLRVGLQGPPGQATMDQILAFTTSNKIPSYFTAPVFVERGGFMSYFPRISENVARAASFVDRILKGANPAEMPFEYPTRFELIINLKTAKQLGITVPRSVLLRADRVIE